LSGTSLSYSSSLYTSSSSLPAQKVSREVLHEDVNEEEAEVTGDSDVSAYDPEDDQVASTSSDEENVEEKRKSFVCKIYMIMISYTIIL